MTPLMGASSSVVWPGFVDCWPPPVFAASEGVWSARTSAFGADSDGAVELGPVASCPEGTVDGGAEHPAIIKTEKKTNSRRGRIAASPTGGCPDCHGCLRRRPAQPRVSHAAVRPYQTVFALPLTTIRSAVVNRRSVLIANALGWTCSTGPCPMGEARLVHWRAAVMPSGERKPRCYRAQLSRKVTIRLNTGASGR